MTDTWHYQEGISLRDYFAAQALAAMQLDTANHYPEQDYNKVAGAAYRYADAMLAQREKQE